MDSFQDLLAEREGAVLEQHRWRFPGSPAALTEYLNQTVICPLYQHGFLAVDGPDAARFLQGQTTCDFNRLDGERAVSGAYCTPKGRMITSFLAGRTGENHYRLRMRRNVVEAGRETLAKYIVFSKAEMRDESEALVALGLYGEGAGRLLDTHLGTVPAGQLQAVQTDGGLAVQLDAQGNRFECWLPPQAAQSLWEAVRADTPPADSALWDLLNIRDGAGEVGAATREAFLPQDLNFQLTGAVNFRKGCYTGQEVVARMHYRGKLKRHMYRAKAESAAPAPGSALRSGDNNQNVGTVVNAVDIGNGRCELLAVLTDSAVAEGGIRTEDGAEVTMAELPYTLQDEPA